jgi:hypothetical protein
LSSETQLAEAGRWKDQHEKQKATRSSRSTRSSSSKKEAASELHKKAAGKKQQKAAKNQHKRAPLYSQIRLVIGGAF